MGLLSDMKILLQITLAALVFGVALADKDEKKDEDVGYDDHGYDDFPFGLGGFGGYGGRHGPGLNPYTSLLGFGGNRYAGYGLGGHTNYGYGQPFGGLGIHGGQSLYGGFGHGRYGHLWYGLGGYGLGGYRHGKNKKKDEDVKEKKSHGRKRAYSPYTLKGLYFPNSHQYGYGGYGYGNNFGNGYGGYNPTYGNTHAGYGGYSQGYAQPY